MAVARVGGRVAIRIRLGLVLRCVGRREVLLLLLVLHHLLHATVLHRGRGEPGQREVGGKREWLHHYRGEARVKPGEGRRGRRELEVVLLLLGYGSGTGARLLRRRGKWVGGRLIGYGRQSVGGRGHGGHIGEGGRGQLGRGCAVGRAMPDQTGIRLLEFADSWLSFLRVFTRHDYRMQCKRLLEIFLDCI